MASKDLLGFAIDADIDVQASGSTCVLFMYKGNTYYTANVGDSRIVIGCGWVLSRIQYQTSSSCLSLIHIF